jgi:hypothetical protein
MFEGVPATDTGAKAALEFVHQWSKAICGLIGEEVRHVWGLNVKFAAAPIAPRRPLGGHFPISAVLGWSKRVFSGRETNFA